MTKEEIKNLRLELGLTQTEFAYKLNASVSSISMWERGEAKPRSVYIEFMKRLKQRCENERNRKSL